MVSADDRKALKFVWRANLDVLWWREPLKVTGNLWQARKMEACGEGIRIRSVSPPIDPFPLEDTFGMKIACTLLCCLLDPGKWEDSIQFATARCLRSAFLNIYQASCQVERVLVILWQRK